jgi:hypothetical protein
LIAAQRVNNLITSKVKSAVCDRCVSKALGLSFNSSVASITTALATTSEFQRELGVCALCGNERMVTRRAKNSPGDKKALPAGANRVVSNEWTKAALIDENRGRAEIDGRATDRACSSEESAP